MLNKLIRWSLANRAIVIGLSILVLVLGVQSARELPVEVLPDLTKPTVTILTEAPGLAPEEVEARVTQPIESALMGVGGLTRLRSNTDVALSLVFAEFEWGTDIYKARTLVQERLQSAREQLPEGVQPFMTPVASLMGEIVLVGVRSTVKEGAPGYLPPREVRSLADWTIRRRLQSIPGIAEILNMGGGVKRIEIQPDPYRMQANGVTLDELQQAAADAANTTTGGFIDNGPTEIMVRNLAMTVQIDDIAQTVVKTVNDRPIAIADVASVAWGTEPMRGDATVSIKEGDGVQTTRGVIMSITKAPRFDTSALTERIKTALDELAPTLPEGVSTTFLFQQKAFIDHAIDNLKEAIRDGAIMVSVVLFVFLLNFRTTFVTLMAMPLSFAITLLCFRWLGISVNSMTLGGLAVAIGMVVDDAIVDVENVHRRLRENAALPHPHARLQVIAQASGEVRNSILYATLLIILVFLPLLGLSGVEGKLFGPIAVATIISMVASFVVSLAAIPVLCSLLLAPKAGHVHRDGPVTRGMKWLLEHTLLRLGLSQPAVLLGSVAIFAVFAFSLYPEMGKDFLPAFREETALVSTTAAPGTSLEEMNALSDAVERQILAVPEVLKVGRRLGRAERGDHVVPVSTAEFDVEFRQPDTARGSRTRQAILADIGDRVRTVPGTFSVVTGPLADRIGHMLSGVSAPVAVKIFGPDLQTLRRLGTEVQAVAAKIPGFENAKLDQQSTIPQLRIEPDRARARAYGVAPGHLTEQLSALVGGQENAELREGQRSVSLVTRLPLEWRDSAEKLASLPVELDGGQRVPLSLVADVREAKGPNAIARENSQRRFAVAIKPTVRDVGALVTRLQREVAEKVTLPEGYFVSYEGEFQAQRDASLRIAVFSGVVLVVIAFLLYGYFRTPFFAVQVLCDIPLALVGGLVLTAWTLNNISIATLVGFIAVAGVAARNSIMLISHYLHLMQHEGEGFTREMVIRGTKERLVPVLMTALSAGIGLIPLVLAGDQPGKEILHPVALVIVGGLVTSTLLGLGVTPTVFHTFGRRAAEKAIERESAASH